MKIPSQEECFKLITEMEMMTHIVDHSIMVSNVARFLCTRLKKVMPKLDIRLAAHAALLHDITKTRSFSTHEVHSETGGRLLTRMGYPEVGNIIRQHVILDAYETESPICEQEIVNYSDKRVLHDQVVSLNRRLDYIERQYGKKDEFKKRIKVMWMNTMKLESKLFLHLDILPEELLDSMKKQQENGEDYFRQDRPHNTGRC